MKNRTFVKHVVYSAVESQWVIELQEEAPGDGGGLSLRGSGVQADRAEEQRAGEGPDRSRVLALSLADQALLLCQLQGKVPRLLL